MTQLEILRRSFKPFPVSDEPPRGCICRSQTRRSSVYLLVDGRDISYVGSAKDTETRVYQHRLLRDRTVRDPILNGVSFDSALWLELPYAVVRSYEAALIRTLRPPYNGNCPKDCENDAEILFGLGLRESLDEFDVAAWEPVN